MRRTALAILLLLIAMAGTYAWLYQVNNRNIPYPSQPEIRQSYQRSVEWLLNNRDLVLKTPNVFLWWMLKQSIHYRADPALQALVSDFERSLPGTPEGDLWRGLFVENSWVPVRPENIRRLDYYQQQYVAVLYCDSELLDMPVIAAQEDADFCTGAGYWYRPACVTHQLLGLRFQQQRNCRAGDRLATTIASLQDRIVRLLTFDVRVVDVYLQRVMMLAESGAAGRIKPVWIQRIIDAQLTDGGWSADRKLVGSDGSPSLNFGSNGFSFRTVRSGFHSTAQGVFLMAMLLDEHARPASASGGRTASGDAAR